MTDFGDFIEIEDIEVIRHWLFCLQLERQISNYLLNVTSFNKSNQHDDLIYYLA